MLLLLLSRVVSGRGLSRRSPSRCSFVLASVRLQWYNVLKNLLLLLLLRQLNAAVESDAALVRQDGLVLDGRRRERSWCCVGQDGQRRHMKRARVAVVVTRVFVAVVAADARGSSVEELSRSCAQFS